MIGLANISANNGWIMAVVGGSIVFSGLVILSVAISQLHKILGVWDGRKNWFNKEDPEIRSAPEVVIEVAISEDMQPAVRNLKLLTQRIGEPFSLPKLLVLSEKFGLARPHSTINRLLTSKIIVPDGNGYFKWNCVEK